MQRLRMTPLICKPSGNSVTTHRVSEFSGEGPQAIGFLHAQIGHVRDTRFRPDRTRQSTATVMAASGEACEVNGSEWPELRRTCYLQALSA